MHNIHSPRPSACMCVSEQTHAYSFNDHGKLLCQGNICPVKTNFLQASCTQKTRLEDQPVFPAQCCAASILLFSSCFGPRSKRRLSWAQLIKTPKRLERLHHEDDSCPKPVVVHHVTPVPRPSYLYDDNDKIPGVMPSVHLVGSIQWHNRKHLVDFSKPFLSSLICIISHTLYNKPTL